MRTILKRAAVLLGVVIVITVVAFYAWTRIERYDAVAEAEALAEKARVEQGWYVFEPDGAPRAGLVFYPGGLVDPAAYAPLMKRLSDDGVLAVVVPMPLDLAVFGVGRAEDVVSAYPEVDTWIIGGHSLGGAMAAEHLKKAPDAFDGVVFLASYPAESTDLSSASLAALTLAGTEDGVSGDVFEESLERLPEAATLEVLEGGNHAQFGDYGPQKGDGTATMSRDAQQRATAAAILELVSSIER